MNQGHPSTPTPPPVMHLGKCKHASTTRKGLPPQRVGEGVPRGVHGHDHTLFAVPAYKDLQAREKWVQLQPQLCPPMVALTSQAEAVESRADPKAGRESGW